MFIILDIARGLAALWVFLFHIHETIGQSIPSLANIAKYGSLGVSLFFVISGYVITASAEAVRRSASSPFTFLKRRFIRIYPPMWASILVVVSMPYFTEWISFFKSGHYVQPNPRFLSLSGTEWLQLATLTKVFIPHEDGLQGAFSPVNSVYWTLAIEFQFYVVVCLCLCFKRYFWQSLAMITAFCIVLPALGCTVNAGLFVNFWTMFALGIGLYYIISNRWTLDRYFKNGCTWISAGLTLLIMSACFGLMKADKLAEVLGSMSSSVALGAAIISAVTLWCAAPMEPILKTTLKEGSFLAKTMVKTGSYLGVISYSIYLLHGRVNGLPGMFARQVVSITSWLYPLLIIVGTLMICSVFYYFFEKPCLSGKHKAINEQALKP